MKEWTDFFTENTILVIEAAALLVIAFGTIEMLVACLRAIFAPTAAGRELREGYLHYARWLIAALTFQLAADIIESARAPSWDDIGRVAAIAAIRTFLNYFLERDIKDARAARSEVAAPASRADAQIAPQL